MDILSHGLWAAGAAQFANLRLKKRVRTPIAFLFGMFPDLFAFGIPFVWALWQIIAGKGAGLFSSHMAGTAGGNGMLGLSYALYNVSHSVFVFLFVFGIVWLILRRPMWEMCGWLLHILFDIPTHSYEFFPTPVFWPLFDWKFDGISWGAPWFMAVNYSALLIVFVVLVVLKRRKMGKM